MPQSEASTFPAFGLSRRELIRRAPLAPALFGFATAACGQDGAASVGLFTALASASIPSGVTTITTQGWARRGVGGARYVFDPAVDAAWVRRHPRSSAILPGGRGFRLDPPDGDVRRYGAAGDGRQDDTAAINEALSRGGSVMLPGPATYRVTDRLLVTVDGTRLRLGASVTLDTRAWRYSGGQVPFGNAIHVTGEDCEIVGEGPTSVIRSNASDANGIGFLHCGGGRVAGLALQGGKGGLSAITDDTFQSGISIINDPASNRRGRTSRTIVEDCVITDWVQYGVNIYGALARDIVLRRNQIRRSGVAADRESVGAGIAITRGVGAVRIEGNTIAENKGCGIFVSSAGVEIRDIAIIDNDIVANGREGVCASEERHFGSVAAVGLRGITIERNRIENNAAAGVRAGTYDGVGSIRALSVVGNRIRGNRGSGVLLQANAEPGRDVDAAVRGNQFIDNADYGIAIGLNRIALRHESNSFERNRRGNSVDHRGGTARPLPAR